jgi:ribose transport system ATP-binding protein
VLDPHAPPLLRIENLLKAFSGLTALDGVSLDVGPGEIVAVAGHNGSGKSTLVKILAGVYSADAGSIRLAPGSGLHFIHQDLGLVGDLSAAENLALMAGSGRAAASPVRTSTEQRRTRDLVARFGTEFDVGRPVRELTPAQRTIVAISRALEGWTHSANILVLDEPTESLHRSEVDVLFEAVRRLAADGAGVIFVSHRLNEVLGLADRVVVLRDGRKVADLPTRELPQARLIELITGADAALLTTAHDRRDAVPSADPVLAVRSLAGATVAHLDLDLHPGEIVGVAGVLGSGREAVPALLYGATRGDAASFAVSGRPYERRSPRASLRRGMAFVPGDRARLGIVRELTARENLSLPHLDTLTGRGGAIALDRERQQTQQLLADYDVRPARPEQRIGLFSGGNQQKLVMARALRANPAVLLLDEPTQGVDVGAKASIYAAIEAGATAGTAVLVSSSDAKELIALCDRVVVMREGRGDVVLRGSDLTEHRLVTEGYGLP